MCKWRPLRPVVPVIATIRQHKEMPSETVVSGANQLGVRSQSIARRHKQSRASRSRIPLARGRGRRSLPHRFAGSSFFSACSFISFSLKFLARSYPINNGAFELSAPCRCGRKPEGPRTRILGLVRSYFLPGTHVHPLSVRPRIVWIVPPLLFLWPICMMIAPWNEDLQY